MPIQQRQAQIYGPRLLNQHTILAAGHSSNARLRVPQEAQTMTLLQCEFPGQGGKPPRIVSPLLHRLTRSTPHVFKRCAAIGASLDCTDTTSIFPRLTRPSLRFAAGNKYGICACVLSNKLRRQRQKIKRKAHNFFLTFVRARPAFPTHAQEPEL